MIFGRHRKQASGMNLIVCQDSSYIHKEMKAVVKELNNHGHNITLHGVDHVSGLIKMLEKSHAKDASGLPTDILMDVSGGNGASGAKKVIEWFEKNHPEAPLPTFNFLSLSLDMGITDAKKLRAADVRIMAGAVDSDELSWLKHHLENPGYKQSLPETKTLRWLLNEKLGLDLPLGQNTNGYSAKKLAELEAFFNKGPAADWMRGTLSLEEAIEQLRSEFTTMSDKLENSLDDDSTPINPNLTADSSFFGATGLPQKGRVVFTKTQANNAYYNGENPILVMNGYDPSVVPLLADRILGGIVVASTYMASHLKLLCETYGVTGLFGVAPKGQKTLKDEFNEEASLEAPPYFDGDSAMIDGHKIWRSQNILVGLDGNGLVFDPPANLKTKRPDKKELGSEERFNVQAMTKGFAQFFAQQGLAAHGVKANVNAIGGKFEMPPGGIGLVRTEQMVASSSSSLRDLKKILMGDNSNAKNFFRYLSYDYEELVQHLEEGPVKIRLFDFVHKEILNKEEQKEFVAKYKKLDIHGGEALAAFPDLYRGQIRAIFDAMSYTGAGRNQPLEIMMPAVQTEKDVLEIKKMIAAEAKSAGIKPERYSFGVMAETLEACKNIDKIAKHCDFISFGTNDLTQQHTGMDRGDLKAHADFAKQNGYDPFKTLAPEILEIVRDTIARGRKTNTALKADVCGAQAANVDTAIKLFDSGVDNVSVAPTLANLYALPMQLNYRRYDALKEKQATPQFAQARGISFKL